MQFDKNGISESLTELRVKACTCLDKQIDVWCFSNTFEAIGKIDIGL